MTDDKNRKGALSDTEEVLTGSDATPDAEGADTPENEPPPPPTEGDGPLGQSHDPKAPRPAGE